MQGAGHNDVELYSQYLERLKQFVSVELVNWRLGEAPPPTSQGGLNHHPRSTAAYSGSTSRGASEGLLLRCWDTDMGMIATEGMFATEGVMASEGRLTAALATPTLSTVDTSSGCATPTNITTTASKSPAKPSPKLSRASATPSPSPSSSSTNQPPAQDLPSLPQDASSITLSTTLLQQHRRHHSRSSSATEKLLWPLESLV